MVAGWIAGVDEYLRQNELSWAQVSSVGLAIPGPYLRYGVLGRSANMPASFEGWDFYTAYSQALAKKAGRAIPVVVGNDGAFGGVGEAQRVRGSGTGAVLMLAPGSGLGIGVHRFARAAAGRATRWRGWRPRTCRRRCTCSGAKPYPCGCGRTWGCVELYTTLAGLPYLLAERLVDLPGPPARAARPTRPSRRRWRCAAWRRRVTRLPSSCSTSRRARWGFTSPT